MTEETGENEVVRALERLSVGAEPPMPDLVPGAIVQGRRLKRRRRIGTALGAAAAVVVLAGGAAALPSLLGSFHRPVEPAASGSSGAGESRFPPLASLRPLVQDLGTLETWTPRDPPVPGGYFRLVEPDGDAVWMYVSVTRTAETAAPAGARDTVAACRTGGGTPVGTPWDGSVKNCRPIQSDPNGTTDPNSGKDRTNEPGSPDGDVLAYYVDAPALTPAMGITRLTADGWTVQILAGSAPQSRDATWSPRGDPSRAATDEATPANPRGGAGGGGGGGLDGTGYPSGAGVPEVAGGLSWETLHALAVDPRLLEAVEQRR
ncbi:hypothetical protein ACFXKG_09970 [Streptomyces sp. NPDC059255]|uniref:hypothetical protein n=1 Tax=Streptomyces sp. NPDC059255 TaxID=3346793 RepID=UPI0036B54FC5